MILILSAALVGILETAHATDNQRIVFKYTGDVSLLNNTRVISQHDIETDFSLETCSNLCFENMQCTAFEICYVNKSHVCRLCDEKHYHFVHDCEESFCKHYQMIDECKVGYVDRETKTCIYKCSDCDCIATFTKQNGVYGIDVFGKSIEVYCEFIGGIAWTVIQRRVDGEVSFNRSWLEYKLGFGDMNSDFWLGNGKMHQLTMYNAAHLKIVLEDVNKTEYVVEYSSFKIRNETFKYELAVDGYNGTAGDGLHFHNGMKFSTWDKDNDLATGTNCAQKYHGGWWFDSCKRVYLNGLYSLDKTGRFYWRMDNGTNLQLLSSKMMIRKKE